MSNEVSMSEIFLDEKFHGFGLNLRVGQDIVTVLITKLFEKCAFNH